MPTTVVGGQTITWTLPPGSPAEHAGSAALSAFVAENGGTVHVTTASPTPTNQSPGEIFNIPGGYATITVNDEALISSTPTSAGWTAVGSGDLLIHDPQMGKGSTYTVSGNNDTVIAVDTTDLIQMTGVGESVYTGDGLATVLIAGSGSVVAGSGNDSISIGSGSVSVGNGYDVINVTGSGTVVAGNGNLAITLGSGSVSVGNGYDVINVTGSGTVVAGNGNLDILVGGSGSIKAGDGSSDLTIGGNGTVVAGDGNNFISLGAGSIQTGDRYDTILLTGSGAHDTISLGSSTDMVTEAGTSTAFISGPGGVAGSIAGGETLTLALNNSAQTQITVSGKGTATIQAGSGVETLTGGAGQDTMTSGGGADVFQFSKQFGGSGVTHTIDNFREGTDQIALGGGYNVNNILQNSAGSFQISGGVGSETLNLGDGTKITVSGVNLKHPLGGSDVT
jgi:hypothetical protein